MASRNSSRRWARPDGAAVEDAKRFLDMERSYALVVDAKDIIA
jgi:hypothetical protein